MNHAARNAQTALVLAALFLAALMLGGCSNLRASEPDSAMGAALRSASQGTPPTDGAIYAAGRETSFFEDPKARRKGDLITIRLQEATAASKSSSTDTEKTSNVDMAAPTLAGQSITKAGNNLLETTIDGSRKFAGKGSSTQQNQLSGSITAVVVEVLPNGNLVIEGDKWLRLNQGDELVRVRGVVRPFDVLADNSVTSDRVADARISYSGRGALAAANRQGWLSRFFNSGLYPY